MKLEKDLEVLDEMIVVARLINKAKNCKNWDAVEFLCDEYSELRIKFESL